MKPALLLALAILVALLEGCAALPPPVERTPSVHIPASPDNALGKLAAQSVPPGKGSGFRPMPYSTWAMDARLTLAQHAQKSLDIQYYLLQNDMTGHTLVKAVRDAALHGVRVRLLVDDLYTADNDRMLLQLAAFPNIEIRLFNPFPAGRAFAFTRWFFAIGDFARINHRMHNKMFIADGAFAIAGGRNIADEYFFNSKGGNFVDFDILVAGDAVPRMGAIFDTYWNSPRVYPLHDLEQSRDSPEKLRAAFDELTADAGQGYPPLSVTEADALGYLPLSADMPHPPLKLLFGSIDVFADDPEKVSGKAERGTDTSTVMYRVMQAMKSAQSGIDIASPYFIPGKPGMDAMQYAHDHGVRMSVMTNSMASNDEPYASAAYGRYRVPMLKLGVSMYEIDSSQLKNDALFGGILRQSIGRSHTKIVLIDDRITFVGSMNMDFRSALSNTELGMLIESTELASDMLDLSARLRAGAYRLRLVQPGDKVQWLGTVNRAEKVYEDEPGVGFGARFELLLFPFISESLL